MSTLFLRKPFFIPSRKHQQHLRSTSKSPSIHEIVSSSTSPSFKYNNNHHGFGPSPCGQGRTGGLHTNCIHCGVAEMLCPRTSREELRVGRHGDGHFYGESITMSRSKALRLTVRSAFLHHVLNMRDCGCRAWHWSIREGSDMGKHHYC